ncbi:MAG: EamA family transporter, partial [Gemmatimonadetes bacterium]|nr:EamA family transporter [Gemmatimonadota bacterium]
GIAAVSRRAGPAARAFSLAGMLRDPGVRYALLTGLTIAGYSIVDKRGVEHVTPFLYMFLLVLGGMLGMLAVIHRRYPRRAFVEEFRRHRASIVAGGLLQFVAYGLVLSAFRLSPVSYVGPFREIGIVIGVALGALVLREPVDRPRLAGVGLITAGAAAIALAP